MVETMVASKVVPSGKRWVDSWVDWMVALKAYSMVASTAVPRVASMVGSMVVMMAERMVDWMVAL